MKMNRVLSVGVLVTAASALLWAGAVFLTAILPVLIYFIGGGIVIIVAGLFLEIRNSRLQKSDRTDRRDDTGNA